MDYQFGIFGHEQQIGTLTEDFTSGNLPQAYLFAGPPRVGKYTLARRLAMILQCDKKGCLECPVCLNILQGYHPDTLEILDVDGEKGTTDSLKIETIREIVRKLSTTTTGKYKILLIKNIERMTIEAANALLKILEEPPSQVIFLFTTQQLEDVLPTIVSRVRVVKFRPLPSAKIFDYLKNKYPHESEEKIQSVTDFSFGLPGRAIHFMENDEDFLKVQGLLKKAKDALEKNNVVEKFALVNEITQDDELYEEFFDVFLLALRYTMLREAENGLNAEKLQKNISVLLQAQDGLRLRKRNVNAKLLFEHLMLQI